MQKRLSALLLAIFLLSVMHSTVFAQAIPDRSQKGSVSVTMMYEEKAVSGGTMTLYQAGEIMEDDGNYSFALTDAFLPSGADLTDVSSAELAEELALYAQDAGLSGVEVKIGNDGKAEFSDLEPGLYLLIEKEAAKGYNKVAPFLVSVPVLENGVYIYEVDASAKMEPVKESDEPGDARDPNKPDRPGSGTKDSGNRTLPQTGQLNWPVPVLAVLGLVLFSAGWMMRFGKKREYDEK